MKSMTTFSKGLVVALIVGLIWGGSKAYKHFFPEKVKSSQITTSATGLPPLAYDKNANAAFRKLPEFNEPADVQSPEIRGAIMGWNGFAAANYAVGGQTTSKGSLCEELGLNVHLSVQNSTTEQGNQLYAFAQGLHDGQAQPTKGVNFVNWMGDGVPNYLAGLNARLKKDFGDEYVAEVITFTGASFGEDKWMVKAKYAKDARGSVTVAVIRDGDWNIAIIKSQLMGWEANNAIGTYDKTKVNFVAAPNDDYVEAGKLYITGQKVTLHIVQNGKLTGKDTSLSVTGVASWFPVDQQIVDNKGGLVTLASTKDFASQMACAIIMIKKWADANKPLVEKLIEAFGKGGDQIKSHDEALQFASKVSEVVFADKEKDAEAWYNAYKSFPKTDDDGNEVQIGGSRAFSLADAAHYTGVSGGSDTYQKIYNTFGSICKEAFPDILSSYPDYSEAVDWSFLRDVYRKNKEAGTEGSVSETDFGSAEKGKLIGDANYTIEFDLGSATIRPSSYPVLDKIIGTLSVANNAFVEVSGHTDNTGNAASNQTLSQQRAKSVADYLKSKDASLSKDRKLTSKGYGQTHTLIGLDPSDPKNRRVEIMVYSAKD